ncbi:MAG TPA: RNA polymerase sigma-70 factor [Bacteroidales bacterium]|nr:RNA polymerase sigma-70 factor [Bacteroidales bacterium]
MNYPEQAVAKMVDYGNTSQISLMDLQSFESMFRQYYQMLCAYAYRFVNDSDTAEEIVQELFYKLWEKKSELQINSSLKSYLYSAVHNRCLKFIEHRNVETRYRNYYLLHESEVDNEPQHSSNARELQGIIDDTLNSLPERCSRIFRLNRYEGLKYNEIALKLSISVKTVEANMGKALKMLRKNLKEYAEMA